MGYDIFGDIHGHADELITLLDKLGYKWDKHRTYYHPEYTAIFAGDFIDRVHCCMTLPVRPLPQML